MWTPDIYSTEARALPSAVNGSVACRPLPRTPLQGWLFQQPRPERHFNVRVPVLSMTRRRSLRGSLLTNSFVSQVECDRQATEEVTRDHPGVVLGVGNFLHVGSFPSHGFCIVVKRP
jgi:hypothetical protein